MRALLTGFLCLLGAGLGQAQSVDCIDAFETLTRVKEEIFSASSKADLEALHHKIRGRTNDCAELTELWEMRARLALMIGDERDAKLSQARGGSKFSLSAQNIAAAQASQGQFDPTRPVAKRWGLVAGTATFQDSGRLQSLEFANQDLNRMQSILADQMRFDDVRSLMGENFTRDNFRAEIARLRDNVEADDLVVIYLLSHGYPTKEDPNNTSFILTYDSDLTDAQRRYVTSIQVVDFVQEVYREFRAQRVILLLDTCYSGDAISGQRDYAGHPAPHLLDAFTRGSGRAVIAASSAKQRSWELPEQRQGAFVHCFDRTTQEVSGAPLGEMYAALKACVSNTVHSVLGPGYSQEPQMFASDGARRMVLAGSP